MLRINMRPQYGSIRRSVNYTLKFIGFQIQKVAVLGLPEYKSTEVDVFAEEIQDRIDAKSYPDGDPDLSEDITYLVCATNERKHPDLLEAEEELEDLFEQINDITDDGKDIQDRNEREMTYAISIELWNKAVSISHSNQEPLRGGDLYNLYSEVDDPELCVRYLRLFRDNYYKNVIESAQFQSDEIESLKNNKFEDEDWERRLLYCGMIFTVWSKYNRIMIPESRMRDPS